LATKKEKIISPFLVEEQGKVWGKNETPHHTGPGYTEPETGPDKQVREPTQEKAKTTTAATKGDG